VEVIMVRQTSVVLNLNPSTFAAVGGRMYLLVMMVMMVVTIRLFMHGWTNKLVLRDLVLRTLRLLSTIQSDITWTSSVR